MFNANNFKNLRTNHKQGSKDVESNEIQSKIQENTIYPNLNVDNLNNHNNMHHQIITIQPKQNG